jgi:hypothetical protein
MKGTVLNAVGEHVGAGASACMLLWVSRTLLGLLIAYPVLNALEATAIGNGPDRDAVLFQPGALLLLELVRVGLPVLGAAFKTMLVLLALSAVVELAPLACALDVLNGGERPFSARVLHSVRLFPSFLGLSGVALATQVALLLATSLLSGALKSALQNADERVRDLAPIALCALVMLALLWTNSVLDLARAAVTERDLGWRGALLHALMVLFEEPLAVLSSSYASAAAGVAAYLSAAWLMTRFSVAGPSGSAIALAFAVHQLALFIGLAWRVRWLARALDLSRSARPQASGGD